MNENIQRIYQLVIDAGGAKAGAEQFRQAAEMIERSAQEAAAAGKPLTDNAARTEREFNRLKMSIDPLHAAQVRLAQGIQVLQKRFEQGGYSVEEMSKDLALLKARYEQTAVSAQRMGAAAASGGGGFRNFNATIQNAGFQIGDFAVQVASGTSAMRAFVQQGPQFLGAIGGVGSKLGGWTAIAGAALAVAGALAMAFWDVGEASEDAADATDLYTDALRAAEELTRAIHGQNQTTIENLQADRRYRIADTEAILAQTQAEIALIEAREVANALEQSPDDIVAALEASAQVIEDRIKPLKDQINGFYDEDGEWVSGLRGVLAELKFGGEMMDPFAAGGTDHSGSKPGSGGARDAGQDAIANLQQRIALFGDLSEEEKALYEVTEGSLKDQSQAEKDLYVQLARQLDIKKALADQEKERAALAKEAYAAIEQADKAGVAEFEKMMADLGRAADAADAAGLAEWQKTMNEGARVMELVRTPAEAYAATIQRLNELYEFGAISSDTYFRAVDKAYEAFSDASDATGYFGDVAKDAMGILQAGLMDAAFEADNLSDALSGVMLQLAKMAGNKALGSFFDWGWDSLFGGSGLSASIDGMLAANPSIFHRGGVVGGPAPTRPVPALAFAGAERFHSGGLPGLRPDEVPAILQRGEIVLPKGVGASSGVAQGSVVSPVFNTTITVKGSGGTTDQNADLARQMAAEFERSARRLVQEEIGVQQRIGGQFNPGLGFGVS